MPSEALPPVTEASCRDSRDARARSVVARTAAALKGALHSAPGPSLRTRRRCPCTPTHARSRRAQGGASGRARGRVTEPGAPGARGNARFSCAPAPTMYVDRNGEWPTELGPARRGPESAARCRRSARAQRDPRCRLGVPLTSGRAAPPAAAPPLRRRSAPARTGHLPPLSSIRRCCCSPPHLPCISFLLPSPPLHTCRPGGARLARLWAALHPGPADLHP